MDAYMELVEAMRSEGAAKNAPDIALCEVISAKPLRVRYSGAELKSGFFVPAGMELSKGDLVAVKRIGEDNVILQKVVEL